MSYQPIELPYAYDALEPYISAKTVEIHYEKHHQGYADKLNETKYGNDENLINLKDIIMNDKGSEFNLAAQLWNHDFYWEGLKPGGGGEPGNTLTPILSHHFGSVDICKKELLDAAKSQFGSGWAWLVMDADKNLKITQTSNAQNPLVENQTPLLTIDVWEHAYYLDYMNERARHIQAVIDHLINWDIVEARYNAAADE